MSLSETYSTTYTSVDVSRVLDQFAADLDMMAQSTGLMSVGHARTTADDLKRWAQKEYVVEINVILRNKQGTVVRAAKYGVSRDAGLWKPSRPGNSLWPRIEGTLEVVIHVSANWTKESPTRQSNFYGTLSGSWGDCNTDTSFLGLSSDSDRQYVSNAFGLKRTTYK